MYRLLYLKRTLRLFSDMNKCKQQKYFCILAFCLIWIASRLETEKGGIAIHCLRNKEKVRILVQALESHQEKIMHSRGVQALKATDERRATPQKHLEQKEVVRQSVFFHPIVQFSTTSALRPVLELYQLCLGYSVFYCFDISELDY